MNERKKKQKNNNTIRTCMAQSVGVQVHFTLLAVRQDVIIYQEDDNEEMGKTRGTIIRFIQ